MDLEELKKEQWKLAQKIVLRDDFTTVRTIGGVECVQSGDNIIACVVVCEYPSMKLKEQKVYTLHNPLPHRLWFEAYREMPAIVEAFNMLEEEPDILIIKGNGILHPRKIGIASHVGLILNKSTIGISEKLLLGNVEKGNVLLEGDVVGFEITTREHAKPLYVSPGNLISLGSVLTIMQSTIISPHKMPEPLHIARKVAKKFAKGVTQ
ncbi:endonuclease V [Candidatus Woesearchaeota archaeon]|jgi:deoxyribonuclease V|nr:endonuclease V [Candidatus Woesearchaeota archaeon]MBT5397172.1 endonuclease V [Candidatus Woesearchaeota archaeon]MBT5924883.1 endonuclease V [Candidatus Woesearchaeota archaeon]MBT6367282.1 endonuclease V [Candidatus Woesearchaeota archaeon]MBT7762572.1 endonuclease V [Candidatus Woesearchaeota archaeon]